MDKVIENKNKTRPIVSVVIINYNGARFLHRLIDSILESFTQANIIGEIIVTDNASNDDSLDIIYEYIMKYKYIKLIRLKRNVGYCLAANIGVFHSKADYVAILNSDVYLDPKWLVHIIRVFESKPRAAIVQPAIYWYQDPQRIQSCGLFGDSVLNYKENRWKNSAILGAFGPAYVVRRSAWKAIGGLDPDYFMYKDELDLGLRAWLAGWMVVLEPDAKCYHWMGGSTQQSYYTQHVKSYLMHRNQLQTITKTFSCSSYLLSFSMLLIVNLIRIFRMKHLTRTILSAYMYYIRNIKRIMLKRRLFTQKKMLKERKLRKWGLLRPVLEI